MRARRLRGKPPLAPAAPPWSTAPREHGTDLTDAEADDGAPKRCPGTAPGAGKSCSSPTPGSRRSTAWCARSPTPCTNCRRLGCEIEVISPADYKRTIPLITYSEIKTGARRARRCRGPLSRLRAGRGSHRHRGHARLGRARGMPEAQVPVHDQLPHAISGIRRPRASRGSRSGPAIATCTRSTTNLAASWWRRRP